MSIRTHLLGYPRIGEQRELKKATELYWKGEIPRVALEAIGRDLRRRNWQKQAAAGIDLVPCNDFSFYDQILDASCLFGNVPPRFEWDGEKAGLDTRFLIARGARTSGNEHQEGCGCADSKAPTFAGEMTKWFDTNYHYIVPEFHAATEFKIADTKIFDEFDEAQKLGLNAKPVLIGPVSYLTLGKVLDRENLDFDRFELLGKLLPVYEEILTKLASQGAEWIQLDEPVLTLDLTDRQRDAFAESYQRLSKAAGSAKLLVATYFGELRENLPLFLSLPVAALHFDAVRGVDEVDRLLSQFPTDKILSLKAKVDAGADYICTQLFFCNHDFYDFRDRCALSSIDVPILAGILPVTSLGGLHRMAELAGGARFPARLIKALQRASGDDSCVRRIGIHYATEQCADLLDHRVSGIHLYTLNQSTATREIFLNLGINHTFET